MIFSIGATFWYTDAVNTMTAKGILNGESKDFNPDDYVTKAELAQMLVNLLDYQAKQIDNIVNQLNYTVKIETDHDIGTGVIIDQDLILTVAHVVGDHTKVTFSGDYKAYSAEIVAIDENLDLALLRTETPAGGVTLSPEDVEVLDTIYIIGTPLGISDVFSYGHVSKLDQGYFHQLEASVSNGNSGGPVFNEEGKLVGIIKSKRTDSDHIAYMIKLSLIKSFINQ